MRAYLWISIIRVDLLLNWECFRRTHFQFLFARTLPRHVVSASQNFYSLYLEPAPTWQTVNQPRVLNAGNTKSTAASFFNCLPLAHPYFLRAQIHFCFVLCTFWACNQHQVTITGLKCSQQEPTGVWAGPKCVRLLPDTSWIGKWAGHGKKSRQYLHNQDHWLIPHLYWQVDLLEQGSFWGMCLTPELLNLASRNPDNPRMGFL